jgi:hypothetical protein
MSYQIIEKKFLASFFFYRREKSQEMQLTPSIEKNLKLHIFIVFQSFQRF